MARPHAFTRKVLALRSAPSAGPTTRRAGPRRWRAIGITGTTVTAAGIILAGAFVVPGFAGGSSQTQELGFSIAFSVVLDTFFVRTLLVPSIAMLLGRWNWWPAPLSRPVPA